MSFSCFLYGFPLYIFFFLYSGIIEYFRFSCQLEGGGKFVKLEQGESFA